MDLGYWSGKLFREIIQGNYSGKLFREIIQGIIYQKINEMLQLSTSGFEVNSHGVLLLCNRNAKYNLQAQNNV